MRKKINNVVKSNVELLTSPFMTFFRHEASSGIILLLFAILALVLANTSLSTFYNEVLNTQMPLGPAKWHLDLTILYWINDGLMAIFFFVIGLEIKREFLFGELKSLSATILPISAAIGGMIVPAILYYLVNMGQDTVSGWGIPMATDIAFSLGILAIAASGAPLSIAIFLTALAIVDDLGAIIVIAIFYNSNISFVALGIGLVALLGAFILNRLNCRNFLPYLLVGLIAWVAFLNAGIHPTIAGVCLGMLIPADNKNHENSLLHKLEHKLEPWSAYAIMPIFALANAGVTVEGGISDILSPIGIGIILGLCIGKPLGICGAAFILFKLGFAKMPEGAKTTQLIGAGSLGGIGFTMSLFIASLAFDNASYLASAKISILCASVLSGILGVIIFKTSKLFKA